MLNDDKVVVYVPQNHAWVTPEVDFEVQLCLLGENVAILHMQES